MSNPRQDANLALVELVLEQLEKDPDLRFGQVIWNLGIVIPDAAGGILDRHAEESLVTLDRAVRRAERLRRAAE